MGGEELDVVDSHTDSVVVIDTSPIGTVDFRLQQKEKEFLLKVGQAAALRFLQKRKLDGGPDDAAVEAAHKEAENARNDVIRMRRRRRMRRILLGLGLLAAIYVLLPRFLGLVSFLWSSFRRHT